MWLQIDVVKIWYIYEFRKDAKSSKEIEEQMKKLSKIQENINLLKQKMAANAKGMVVVDVKPRELNLNDRIS